jgi:hypothetical protein
MRTARTLEAEWMQVLRGEHEFRGKEDETSNGHVWATGFHHVTPRPHLADVLKLTNHSFL